MTGQQQKKYKVARAFRDSKGKDWNAGEDYTETDQAEVNVNVTHGNITASGAGTGKPREDNAD